MNFSSRRRGELSETLIEDKKDEKAENIPMVNLDNSFDYVESVLKALQWCQFISDVPDYVDDPVIKFVNADDKNSESVEDVLQGMLKVLSLGQDQIRDPGTFLALLVEKSPTIKSRCSYQIKILCKCTICGKTESKFYRIPILKLSKSCSDDASDTLETLLLKKLQEMVADRNAMKICINCNCRLTVHRIAAPIHKLPKLLFATFDTEKGRKTPQSNTNTTLKVFEKINLMGKPYFCKAIIAPAKNGYITDIQTDEGERNTIYE